MRSDYDPRMRRFWEHGLCPITGYKTTRAYNKVIGTSGLKSLKLPTINLNRFRNHKV